MLILQIYGPLAQKNVLFWNNFSHFIGAASTFLLENNKPRYETHKKLMSLETVYKSRFSNEAVLLSNLPVYLEALAKNKEKRGAQLSRE